MIFLKENLAFVEQILLFYIFTQDFMNNVNNEMNKQLYFCIIH